MSVAENKPSGEVDLESVYLRLAHRSIHDVLGIQGNARPDVLLQRLNELRTQVATLAGAEDMAELSTAMMARVREIETIVLDPLEWFIHARSASLRQDPKDPTVRSMLEAQFLEAHLPRAVWLMTVAWGAVDPRRQHRFPILCSARVELPGQAAIAVETENLSRSGVRLIGLPPQGPDKGDVKLALVLPGNQEPVLVGGTIMWRKIDRIGVAFKDVAPQAAAAIDIALKQHFDVVVKLAERYAALAPQDPTAIACLCIARGFATEDEKLRTAQLEAATAAATTAPKSLELQLAVAKLAISLGVKPRAQNALRRAAEISPQDPRIAELTPGIDGRGGPSALRNALADAKRVFSDARVAIVAIPLILVAAGAAIYLNVPKGPQVVQLSAAGLPCARAALGGKELLCFLAEGTPAPVPPSSWEDRADISLRELKEHGITSVSLFDAKGLPVAHYGEGDAAATGLAK